MISDNPIVSLGNVDFSLYTPCMALRGVFPKKRMEMLAYTPVEFNYMETLAETFIFPARQNQFVHENIFNNAPARRSPFQSIHSLQLQDRTLKIYSGTNSLNADKLE